MNENNEEKFFICSRCFITLTEFMLGNPKNLKEKNFPTHLTVYPVESADTHRKCERCAKNTVDGYMPLAKAEQVMVT